MIYTIRSLMILMLLIAVCCAVTRVNPIFGTFALYSLATLRAIYVFSNPDLGGVAASARMLHWALCVATAFVAFAVFLWLIFTHKPI